MLLLRARNRLIPFSNIAPWLDSCYLFVVFTVSLVIEDQNIFALVNWGLNEHKLTNNDMNDNINVGRRIVLLFSYYAYADLYDSRLVISKNDKPDHGDLENCILCYGTECPDDFAKVQIQCRMNIAINMLDSLDVCLHHS